METIGIFLSSTIEDLKEERKAIAEAINSRLECKAVYAESFPASTLSPKKACLEAVNKSDIYVGIFNKRYGFIPLNDNPNQDSVTVIEYKEAKTIGLPRLIFINKDRDGAEEKLAIFLKEIADFNVGHYVKFYSSKEELVKFILEAIDSKSVRECVTARLQAKQEQKIYDLPYFSRLMERI
jgi:hypothetical protein